MVFKTASSSSNGDLVIPNFTPSHSLSSYTTCRERMGSNYFERGEINGASSRKGKKSGSDKPRQPQRGLGVAQLERIRLHSQMASTYLPSLQSPFSANYNHENMRVETSYSSLPSPSSLSYSLSSSSPPSSYDFFQNVKMGLGDEHERSNVGYREHQPTTAARWEMSNGILEAHRFAKPNVGRQSVNIKLVEDQITKSKRHRKNSMWPSNQILELNETQELDLELRLSI